jgi:anti-sigma factor RsiW
MSDSDRNHTIPGGCDETRAFFEDWLDGLLDDETRTRFNAHIETCRECRDFLSQRRALADDLLMLGRAADALADAGVPKTVPRLLRWRSWSIVAATVLFFLTAGLYFSEFRHLGGTGSGISGPEPSSTNAANERSRASSASDRDFGVTCPDGCMLVPMTSDNPRIHIVWLYERTVLPVASVDGEPDHQPAPSD